MTNKPVTVAIPVLDRAACKGEEPELWQAIDAREQVYLPRARTICRNCPDRDPCLKWAIDTDQQFGLWGGLSPKERRRLKRGTP